MKRWSTRWHRLPDRGFVGALALLALLPVGCVTRSTHNEVVGALEADVSRLEGEVRDIQRSNRSLGDERVRLIDEMEDLRQEREVLARDVEKLSKTKALLSDHLREREAQVAELAKATSTYRGLVDDLEAEVSAGQIQIEQLREGIRMNLSQDILFRSGQASLEGSGVAVLRKVSKQLVGMTHRVEVQGHTDDVPLSPALASRWGTNWELAAARAASVVRLFENGAILPTPFIDLRPKVNTYWDRGLLGIAADTNFLTNGYVYLLYVYEHDAANFTGSKTSRLVRVTATGDVADSRRMMVAAIDRGPPLRVLRPETLFEIDDNYYLANNSTSYRVADDDQRFLMARFLGEGARIELVFVQNFFQVLRDRAPR